MENFYFCLDLSVLSRQGSEFEIYVLSRYPLHIFNIKLFTILVENSKKGLTKQTSSGREKTKWPPASFWFPLDRVAYTRFSRSRYLATTFYCGRILSRPQYSFGSRVIASYFINLSCRDNMRLYILLGSR